jgi:fructose-1-phosphate kinase PfkB-like protein
MNMLIMTVCFLTAVKFLLIAFWMMDQPFRRAARVNLVGAGLCVVAGVAYGLGNVLVPVLAVIVALALGLNSFRMVRTGRG